MIYLKWWRGKTYNQDDSTQQDSLSDLMEKSKAFQTSKVKKIQHHQTSFITNAKGISLGKKHRRRKRPTENKPQTIKKMVIGSCVLCCASLLSPVWLFATLWTVASQAPLSMGILQAGILAWFVMPSSRGSSQPRDWTQVSCTAGGFLKKKLKKS